MPYGLIATDSITDSSGGVLAPSSSVFRNRIINGAMVIDQRNAGSSVTQTTSVLYSVDRWAIYGNVTSKFTAQQNAGSVTPPAGYINYLGITSSSAYSIGSTDDFQLIQRVEGLNCADLAWGTASAATVTLSFWVRSSLTGTFGGSLSNSASNRSYPFTYTISSANTWEQKSITIAGDTSGTWLTTNGVGIQISFGLGVGSTYSGTAGTWAATNYQSATGATSVVGTNGATFYITGVQLEKGSTATSFDYRPYGTELALCQRYYEKSFDLTNAPANGGATTFSTTSGIFGAFAFNCAIPTSYIQFKVIKRTQPTVTTYGNSSGFWGYTTSSSAPTFNTSAFAVVSISDAGVSFNQQVVNNTPTCVMGHWVASAEL